jgi:hypothetical protein
MSNKESKSDDPSQTRNVIFNAQVTEAQGLYSQLLAIATGVFAGTLIFLEKIAPSPTKESLLLLAAGWLSLLACMILTVWIRWKNVESCRVYLVSGLEAGKKIEKFNRLLTRVAIVCLLCGTLFIAGFSFWNIYHKTARAHTNPRRKDHQGVEKVQIDKGTSRCPGKEREGRGKNTYTKQ